MSDDHSYPDFSGDDFANDKEILATRAAAKAHAKMINDSLAKIQQELDLKKASHINFKSFHMFKSLGAVINQSMKTIIHGRELRVAVVTYRSSFPLARGSNSGTDMYFIGYFTCNTSFPRTYIHQETIKEKIEDIFLKQDVDFPQFRKFSSKFQVLTEDRFKLETILQGIDMDVLSKYPEMELEFLTNRIIFRSSRRSVSIKEALLFSELSKKLIRMFK